MQTQILLLNLRPIQMDIHRALADYGRLDLVESELLMSRVAAVVEIVHPDGVWVTIRLKDGRVDQGTLLTCLETGDKFRVENFALSGWKAMAEGQRTVLLAAVMVSIQFLRWCLGCISMAKRTRRRLADTLCRPRPAYPLPVSPIRCL